MTNLFPFVFVLLDLGQGLAATAATAAAGDICFIWGWTDFLSYDE